MEKTKSVDCITQHINAFREQARRKEQADFKVPCRSCPHNKECNFDWIKTMKPILADASVKIEIIPDTPEIQQAKKDIDAIIEDKLLAEQAKNLLYK